MSEKVKGYILVHPPAGNKSDPRFHNLCFDIVVHKDYYEQYEFMKEDLLYDCSECPYAKTFLNTHKDYIYLGSEDLQHLFHLNVCTLLTIVRLAKEGFKITVV